MTGVSRDWHSDTSTTGYREVLTMAGLDEVTGRSDYSGR